MPRYQIWSFWRLGKMFCSIGKLGRKPCRRSFNFDLTESQKALARAVLDTGKPVVAFLNHSKPVTLNELGGEFKAILAGHYSGQQTGTGC